MAFRLSHITLILLFLSACKENPVTVELPPRPNPNLSDITYKQIDYDLYSVRHASGSTFISDSIIAVSIGIVDSTGFRVKDSLSSTRDNLNNTFRLDFYAVCAFDISKPEINIRVRYYTQSGQWTDHDSALSTMKYPYPGTELAWLSSPWFVEDIDIDGSLIYGQNDFGVFIYDMSTQTTRTIRPNSYEAIAVVDGRYVFYDHVNWSIYRYDLVTDSMTLFIHHQSGRFLLGLEYYNSELYELLYENPTISLLKYDLSGQLLDSTVINRQVSRMSIQDGIAYFHAWASPREIYSYDLSTHTFLQTFKAPAKDHEGIRVRNGFVYYSDFDKKAVGRFPFDELSVYGRIQ